jgi:hypothetical protein
VGSIDVEMGKVKRLFRIFPAQHSMGRRRIFGEFARSLIIGREVELRNRFPSDFSRLACEPLPPRPVQVAPWSGGSPREERAKAKPEKPRSADFQIQISTLPATQKK